MGYNMATLKVKEYELKLSNDECIALENLLTNIDEIDPSIFGLSLNQIRLLKSLWMQLPLCEDDE